MGAGPLMTVVAGVTAVESPRAVPGVRRRDVARPLRLMSLRRTSTSTDDLVDVIPVTGTDDIILSEKYANQSHDRCAYNPADAQTPNDRSKNITVVPPVLYKCVLDIQGAANKSNPLQCFVNISTTNKNL